MKQIYKLFVTLWVTLFASFVWAQDGLFEVHGTNTTYGEYSGKAWVRGGQVQRVIRFKDYRYQGFALETVWVGTVSADKFQFLLPLSNILTNFGAFAPAAEELANPVAITLPVSIQQQTTAFDLRYDGHYEESWQRTGEPGARSEEHTSELQSH